MKIYLVGGAVRDKLLGLPVTEQDYVVVGSTIEEMLAQGYRQVGKEFPVFLHPKTGEEYALARAERKVKPGYQGFIFETTATVTLEEDLKRRDLTINAMAMDLGTGQIIDPFGGQEDLKNKLLRHVSDAFAEDPVRILRVGRFLARYHYLGFVIDAETFKLMRTMVGAGEVNALIAERVWKELNRALTEKNPEMFFLTLSQCDALPILFRRLTMDNPGVAALICANALSPDPIIRFAALFYAYGDKKEISELCHRYRVPNNYRELTILTALHANTALNAKKLTAGELLKLFNALDIFRRFKRFELFLTVCQAIAIANQIEFDRPWLEAGAMIAKRIDVQALISLGFTQQALATKLKEERERAIGTWLTG